MKNLKTITAALMIFVSIVMLISACSKQRTEEELNEYSSPDDFMYENRPEEQTFTLTGDSGGPIIGNQDTHLWMDSSIFMYTNGNDVSYPITIKLIEIYKPKDMELYEMPTVAQGNLLVTGGEIRVRAFKDNDELVLKPNKVYACKMPSQNLDANMSIFYGKEVGDIIDWMDNASDVSTNSGINSLEFITPDSSDYYSLLVPVMGWINCDYFYNTTNPTTLTFDSDVDDLTNVVKFLYFPDIKSVMEVYGNVSGNIPVGANVKVLCFAANSSGSMFYFYQDMTVAANQTTMVTMTQISEADLLTLMDGL